MDNYNQETSVFSYSQSENQAGTLAKSFMSNVFMWMFVALGVSAICAYLFATTPALLEMLFSADGRHLSIFGYAVMFAPLGFVLLMSFGYQRLSAPALVVIFLLYAAITGISLSFILLAYTAGSVLGCFLSAAAMFGVMAVMGYTTKQDLTTFGRIMTMGLIGIVIAMVINFFLHSSTMSYIISIIGVMVFTGLTAYDVQRLKRIGAGIEYEGVPATEVKKLSILGALRLYLDFINLFLMLLRLFGSRRN